MKSRFDDNILNHSVTEHMRTDIARLRLDLTVGEALQGLRTHPPEGRVIYFYVVDSAGRLHGVVPTRRLLLSSLDKPLSEIMVAPVVALPDHATILEACEFFIQHRFLAFPVVDSKQHVIGAIDVELYTDELSDLEKREEQTDLFQLIGVHLSGVQQASSLVSFRKRLPWLLCNIGGGIMAAFISGFYEEELRHTVAIAMFIPVVLALAESVSIQSVTLALQTLHGQRPTWLTMLLKLRRELVTGLLLGAASGLIVATVSLLWLRLPRLVWCLLGGITAGMTGAAVFGLSMPYLLRILKKDPQVAAGPVSLAFADMFTLLIYLSLARWLFS